MILLREAQKVLEVLLFCLFVCVLEAHTSHLPHASLYFMDVFFLCLQDFLCQAISQPPSKLIQVHLSVWKKIKFVCLVRSMWANCFLLPSRFQYLFQISKGTQKLCGTQHRKFFPFTLISYQICPQVLFCVSISFLRYSIKGMRRILLPQPLNFTSEFEIIFPLLSSANCSFSRNLKRI